MRRAQNNLYYQCVVYQSKARSGNVATLLHYIGYTHKLALSVHPLTDGRRYFLAVIADTPSIAMQHRIKEALSSGQTVDLPQNVVVNLFHQHSRETESVTHGRNRKKVRSRT
jgi:hypothetical protein